MPSYRVYNSNSMRVGKMTSSGGRASSWLISPVSMRTGEQIVANSKKPVPIALMAPMCRVIFCISKRYDRFLKGKFSSPGLNMVILV